jgi:hypothetical protein
MIKHTTQFLAQMVAVWSIGAFLSFTAAAQHGPGRHGGDAGQREQGQTPTLTGEWRLNQTLSDDLAKAMQSLHGAGDGQTSSGGMGGHGPGVHGRSGHGSMDPEKMRTVRTRVSRAIEAPARLTITQADGSITFTDGDGRSQTLATNNKKEKRSFDARTVDVRTKWDDGRLVRETFLDDRMKLTETYSLMPTPRQLQVLVKLEGSPLPRAINVRRLYDAERIQ